MKIKERTESKISKKKNVGLINFLHLVALSIGIDAQTKLQHPMDSIAECVRLVEAEAGGE